MYVPNPLDGSATWSYQADEKSAPHLFDIRAALISFVPVFTRPINSSISFGLLPDASIMEGFSILTGMSARLFFIYSFPHSHLGYCMLKFSMGLTNYKFNITRFIEHSEMIAENIL